MVVRNERGIAIIWVTVSMFLILALAAIAIDLSFLYTDKNYLHVSADSAALASISKITDLNDCAAASGSANYPVRETAMEYAGFHSGGSGTNGAVSLDANDSNDAAGDIVLGHYTRDGDPSTDDLTPCQDAGGTPVTAVRVRARRDDAPSFFGGIFGKKPISKVGTYATASSGVKADLPLCVPSCVAFDPACKDTPILLQPDSEETAAWTNFFDDSSKVYEGAEYYINNPESIACIAYGAEPINLKNGAPTPIYSVLDDAINDDTGDADGPGRTVYYPSNPLTKVLPVCKWDTCASSCDAGPGYGSPGSGGKLEVVGQITLNIYSVQPNPEGHPPRSCDNYPNLPKGICAEFSSTGAGLPMGNCDKLVE